MGTFDSVYKNKIRLLEEENRRLKKILSEAEKGTPADRVMGKRTPLDQMSSDEAYQHGQDHAMLQGISTPAHFFKNRHFAAGFNSALRFGTERSDVPDEDVDPNYDGPWAEELD